MSEPPIHVVFAEEDTLFRLMEMGLRRRLTPEGEKTLRYFFGDEFAAPLARLCAMAQSLGLPDDVQTRICQDGAALDAALPQADFVVVEASEITAARVAAGARRLRLIQQFGRATDNIDLAAARRVGIPVANLLRLSSQSCTDHITALVLALARRLLPAHRAVLARRDAAQAPEFSTDPPRNKFNWAGIRGFRILSQSTIGFLGMGENSGFVARRLADMGMRVLYHKRNRLSAADEQALGGIIYVPLDEMLAQSDFVSLHLPYSSQTEKYADAAFFAKMKPGAYLINSARGGIVDEAALYDALRSGHLGGAALDVYRYEPVTANSPLLGLDNIIWTPHIAGGEPEYMIEEAEAVLRNIAAVLHGKAPSGLVTA